MILYSSVTLTCQVIVTSEVSAKYHASRVVSKSNRAKQGALWSIIGNKADRRKSRALILSYIIT